MTVHDGQRPGANPQGGNVGNLGDVLKHAALLALADVMAARNTARMLNYLDTHAYRVDAPLANPDWRRDVDRLAAEHPAYGRYRERERRWVDRGRYLCSVGLAREALARARFHLSDRDADVRRDLRTRLGGRAVVPATVLTAASAWSAPGRVWPRRPLLALVDPFRLTPAIWGQAVAALGGLHAPGEDGAVLVFDYAAGDSTRWPSAPGGWQGPLAVIDRPPYRLAVYGTGGVCAPALDSLVSLGWSRPAERAPQVGAGGYAADADTPVRGRIPARS